MLLHLGTNSLHTFFIKHEQNDKSHPSSGLICNDESKLASEIQQNQKVKETDHLNQIRQPFEGIQMQQN